MDEHQRIVALEFQVGQLQRKLKFVLDHLGLTYAENVLAPAEQAAMDQLRHGNKIEAIKVYQRLSGLGLKESKDAVERLESSLGSR